MTRKILKRLFFILVSILLLGMVAILGFYLLVKTGSFGPLPDEEELADIHQATATEVFSADHRLIGRIFSENRTNASYEDLPENLINALIATEDVRYFEHEGIDQKSLLRVLVKTIILGDESSGGGSTITQQLAKNLFGRRNFGFMTIPVNKTKEIVLARRLESLYTKEEILLMYLNTVPFSENVYGIETAANRFFSKKPKELEPHQSAVLVGMLKANTWYNPRLHPDHSLSRRNVVLHQMYRYGYLSEEVADSLKQLPLDLDYRNLQEDSSAPYFLTHVRRRATSFLAEAGLEEEYDLEMDGLRIYTTLNAEMQQYAMEAMRSHLAWLQEVFDQHWAGRNPWGSNEKIFERELKKSRSYRSLVERGLSDDSLQYYLEKPEPVLLYHPDDGDTVVDISIKDSVAYYVKLLRSGFLALHPQDGAVLAWVGGQDHQLLPYDHVLATRQAASTFKPFVYAAALEQGVEPCNYIPNERRVYEEYEDWAPRNYDNEYGGFYSMQGALKKSVNVAAVHTLFEVGRENVLATARNLGIDSRQPGDPTVALGTGSVSLLEMVRAYSAFANGGERVEPYMISRIEDADGNILYQKESPQREKVLSEETARLMTEMLRGVVNDGTGSKLRHRYGLRGQLAGKTGTAQNYADGWFIGYNPEIVAGVWVGGSSPGIHFRTGTYGSGSTMALPIFGRFFQKVQANADLRKYSNARFSPLAEELEEMLDCEDYRDKNLMDAILGIFKDEPGRKVKEEKKEKKGFFKRLFGGGED